MRGPIVLAVSVVVFYVLACALSPWGKCGRCKGQRRIYATKKKRGYSRPCPRCRGTGIRLRIGRRIFNRLSDAKGRAEARPVSIPERDRPRSAR